MRYKCLLIDHDDTAVDSTPHIHYPAHREQMKRLNREQDILDLESWFRVNYNPGIRPYLQDILKLSPQDEKLCYTIWREFTRASDPPFFPGMLDLLNRFVKQGGEVFVISHSEEDVIERHYRNQQEYPGFMPRAIFGWTGKPEENKPDPWPVKQIEQHFGYSPKEMLMVDDLRPGIEMAQASGVDSLGAGWSHRISDIQQDLAREATVFFDSLEKAATWILEDKW